MGSLVSLSKTLAFMEVRSLSQTYRTDSEACNLTCTVHLAQRALHCACGQAECDHGAVFFVESQPMSGSNASYGTRGHPDMCSDI